MIEARLHQVYDATARYLRELDGLTTDDLAAPSVLPGWTRAHVVAHIALHALGTSRALTGLAHGHPVPVYDSDERRDADIEAMSQAPVDRLRELSFDACGRFKDATEAIHGSDATWDAMIERTPHGQAFTAEGIVDARWREVEIHHADLDAGYSPRDWPRAFTSYIFDLVLQDRGDSVDVRLHLPGGELVLGDGSGGSVAGDAGSMAYWLLGRDTGSGLTGDRPTLGPWTRRTPVR